MTFPSFERSPQLYVRWGGIFYLAIIILGMFGELYVRGTLIVSGDPAATAHRIATSEFLWRAGIVGDILMHVLDIPSILIFYLLLKPINKGLAQLSTLFNMIQTAVLATNKLNLLLPIFLVADSTTLKAFSPEQLQALSTLALNTHSYGFGIGLIFFGFTCLVRGYLIFKSEFIPKIFGILIILAGLSYLINSFALILVPSLANMLFPAILLPAFVGEMAISLWMIIKGIKTEPWQKWMKLKAGHGA